MQSMVLEEMNNIVNMNVKDTKLNNLLKSFILEKNDEKLLFSNLTNYIHKMFRGASPHLHTISAIAELILLSIDILDDLQDQDNYTVAWMKCPAGDAMNGMILFLTNSINQLTYVKQESNITLEMISGINNYLNKIIIGQHMDINDQTILHEEDYISMIQQKSGSAIQLVFYMGFMSTGHFEPQEHQKLNELANLFGIIQQIENDILDLFRQDAKNDLLHKKRTLPVLYLLKHNSEFPLIKQYYDNEITKEEFLEKRDEINQIVKESGCIEYSKVIQTLYINKFDEIFETLDAVSPWKEKFKDLIYTTG